eukprot:g2444.t1
MNDRIGLFQHDEIANQLGKGKRPSPAWTTGGKFAILSGSSWSRVCLQEGYLTSVEALIEQQKLQRLLQAQLGYSEPCLGLEPLRRFAHKDAAAAAERFSVALHELLDDQRFPVELSRQISLRHQQETWSLISVLLTAFQQRTGDEGVLLGVQKWLRNVCRTYIAQKLHSFRKLEPKERYLRTLALLVASGLNLDAARLAIVEGEVILGQLLMCREHPDFVPRLMGSYMEILREELRHKSRPLLLGILDLLCGKGKWLLDQLDVDWKIQLAVHLSSKMDMSPIDKILQFHKEHSPQTALEDVQFQLMVFFCKLSNGQSMDQQQILQLLKSKSSAEKRVDDLMAWQLFAVLSSIEGISNSSTDENEELSLFFNDLCEHCEAAKLPEWSVFVTLHRAVSPSVVESHVRRILEMSTAHWINKPDIQSFLTTQLQIQSGWIAAAKAAWYKAQHNYEAEFECLIEASSFDEAHHVLFVKNRSEDLKSIKDFNLNCKVHLMTVSGLIENQNLIAKWELGGGLVLGLQSLLETSVEDKTKLPSLLDHVKRLRSAALEGLEFWISSSDTNEDKLRLRKFFGLMILKAEFKYCETYAELIGSDHVMSRVLIEGCHIREQRLVI